MRRRSVVIKLIVMFALITGITLTVVGSVISLSINIYDTNEEERLLESQSEVIKESLLKYLNQEADNDVEDLLSMGSASSKFDIFIVDKLGYIYLTSNEELRELEYTKIQINEELLDVKSIEKLELIIEGTELVTYIDPVYLNGEIEAYIVMSKREESDSMNIVLFSMICGIWGIITSMLVVTYFTRKIVITPIENITNAAKRLAKGDVEKRAEVVSNDEIGELAESFNAMAESLENVDMKRKEFISNVSHELRSPITSIKGFITGILDGLVPKDKENYYLKIVYDEIERLTRLVNELLEISSMESGRFNLVESEFDINKVIETCILNLENKIKTKKLDVRAIFDSKRTFVIADRDRIIQVLTNILENAIKYGYENGRIEIAVELKGNKVYISIFNTGDTLSKEDLNNIWERFYKVDKARSSKSSTGLGLAIVRLILNQHNQDIWVENVNNRGVRFTFSLEKSD